jgi:energy-coupling factor transporter ATP-binding protein EcfA2
VPREFPGALTGRLAVDGRPGIVFQDPESQLVMDRVEDDVAFGLENLGWPPERMRPAVHRAIDQAGLTGLERRRPNTLSGGEQQRLALAGAVAPEPPILVLDEPTANLAPAGAVAFLERLAALRAAGSTTIVLIEHRVDLAWQLADLVLVLGADGRQMDFGRPAEVLERSGDRMAEAGVWLPSDRPHFGAVPPAPTGGELARAESVSFGYVTGSPVVAGVDLRVLEGERLALLGANGSGKSTLGRLLVGLLRPRQGRVRLAGRDPVRLPAAGLARLAGYVFQDPEHQFLARTVQGEVELGLRADELTAVPGLMEALGLPLGAFGERSPYTLSGGEKRRLSLACVLVRRPRLLVLDEPTFGLDRSNHEALVGLLSERVDAGTALVAATHDLRFAGALFPRAVVLDRGRLIVDGPTELAVERVS